MYKVAFRSFRRADMGGLHTYTNIQVQSHTHRCMAGLAEKSGDDPGGDEQQQLVADAGAPVLVL